uniref:Putative N-acetylglucosaminylphosphatidylinositol de-N-acetylase n=1 Tax=viral metagenome TaxID=1070528 RepID=A0A6M3KJT7_9ZZZZ
MKTILAVGGHMDDVEMGCGGTLLKHINNGDSVRIAITNSDDKLAGNPKIRMREQANANKISGFSINMFTSKDNIEDIIGFLDLKYPNIIFSMFENDTHHHHIRAAKIGLAVGRKKNITVFQYDGGSSYNFNPNIFSIIDFNKKLELLNCFKSQIERKTIKIDIMRKKEEYWGSLISDENVCAEAFFVRKMKYGI